MFASHAAARPAPAPLCQFKAGMLTATPQTEDSNRFKIEADTRRGLVLLQRGTDGALHLVWRDRASQQTVEDLLVFPGDQSFSRVDTGRAEDRVYLLSFLTSPQKRMFFWMQEPSGGSADEARIGDINRLMNPSASSAASSSLGRGSSAVAAAATVGFDELTAILSDLGYSDAPQQEQQPTKMEEEEEDSAANKKKDDDDDDRLLRQLSRVRAPGLSRILTGDALERVAFSESSAAELLQLLPPGQQTEEELQLTLRSPQLRQSLVQLTRAIRDGGAFPLVASSLGLELTPDVLAEWERGDEVTAFIRLLLRQQQVRKE